MEYQYSSKNYLLINLQTKQTTNTAMKTTTTKETTVVKGEITRKTMQRAIPPTTIADTTKDPIITEGRINMRRNIRSTTTRSRITR